MNNKENLYLNLAILHYRLDNPKTDKDLIKLHILEFIGNDSILDYSLSEIENYIGGKLNEKM